ncbi:MAG: DMT family transporter [Flexibacteraceae bacterium]
MPYLILLLITFIIGCTLPIQAGINAQLAKQIEHPLFSSIISVTVALIGLLAIYAVKVNDRFNLSALKQVSPSLYIGGLIGSVYLYGIVLLIPKIGSLMAFTLIIAGQLVMAMIIDHYGLLGMEQQSITYKSIIGVALIGFGIYMIKK